MNVSDRIQKYYDLNTTLSYISNEKLTELINKDTKDDRRGVGFTRIIEVKETKVFVKTVPLTDLEYANPFDSSNLFDLPSYYNYGVGSAGINCYRELLMHIKTTNWVLCGKIINFPLLYHFRIMKADAEENKNKKTDNLSDLDDHINYWNNNQNIKLYIEARDNAKHQIILFLEYIPIVLYKWLNDDGERIKLYLKEITAVIKFLNDNNIIHFDSHGGNILTDGEHIYLSDFGLVLDKEFNLSKKENEFFELNKYYDYGLAYKQVVDVLFVAVYDEKNIKYFENKYNFNKDTPAVIREKIIFDNFDEICDYLQFNKKYCKIAWKLKNVIMLFNNFMDELRENNKKDNVFPNSEFKKLLLELK